MSQRTFTRAPNPHAAPPVAIATRRNMFGTMGAFLLLTAAEAGDAKAQELDGELMACCSELLAIDAESDRLDAVAAATDGGDPRHPAWFAADDYSDATNDRWHELANQIVATPARTPEGLRAKVQAARTAIHGEAKDTPDPMDRLAWSVFDDVLGRVGA